MPRTVLVLVAFLPAWSLGLSRGIETSHGFTDRVSPAHRIARYEPLREPLRDVTRADLLAVRVPVRKSKQAFWEAQYSLAPTVLTLLPDPRRALRQSLRSDPHRLVVELPSHAEFLAFQRRYQRKAVRAGRAVRVHDVGTGVGFIESRSRP